MRPTGAILIGLINQSAPFANLQGQESLDMALALANYELPVALYFIDDGVFALAKQHQPANINRKDYSKTFAALPFYDIEQIYVCQQSLEARSLCSDNLSVAATPLTPEQLQQQWQACQHLVRF